jgi:serine/threonine protein kinase
MKLNSAVARMVACEQGETPPSWLWQGLILAGRYQVQAWVADGTHGVVHRAQDLQTGSQVVIKQVEDRHLALNEARLLASLEHPSLISLLDFLYDEVTAYLVQQYIEGWPLRVWTAGAEGRPRYLRGEELLDVGRQLAEVMAYLHGQPSPIVHRDIHTDNLLRQADGRIRLIDLALAIRLVDEGPSTLSTLSAEICDVRALLARLLPPGAPVDLAWRLRGCPLAGVPFTAQQLTEDLLAMKEDLLTFCQGEPF